MEHGEFKQLIEWHGIGNQILISLAYWKVLQTLGAGFMLSQGHEGRGSAPSLRKLRSWAWNLKWRGLQREGAKERNRDSARRVFRKSLGCVCSKQVHTSLLSAHRSRKVRGPRPSVWQPSRCGGPSLGMWRQGPTGVRWCGLSLANIATTDPRVGEGLTSSVAMERNCGRVKFFSIIIATGTSGGDDKWAKGSGVRTVRSQPLSRGPIIWSLNRGAVTAIKVYFHRNTAVATGARDPGMTKCFPRSQTLGKSCAVRSFWQECRWPFSEVCHQLPSETGCSGASLASCSDGNENRNARAWTISVIWFWKHVWMTSVLGGCW